MPLPIDFCVIHSRTSVNISKLKMGVLQLFTYNLVFKINSVFKIILEWYGISL